MKIIQAGCNTSPSCTTPRPCTITGPKYSSELHWKESLFSVPVQQCLHYLDPYIVDECPSTFLPLSQMGEHLCPNRRFVCKKQLLKLQEAHWIGMFINFINYIVSKFIFRKILNHKRIKKGNQDSFVSSGSTNAVFSSLTNITLLFIGHKFCENRPRSVHKLWFQTESCL